MSDNEPKGGDGVSEQARIFNLMDEIKKMEAVREGGDKAKLIEAMKKAGAAAVFSMPLDSPQSKEIMELLRPGPKFFSVECLARYAADNHPDGADVYYSMLGATLVVGGRPVAACQYRWSRQVDLLRAVKVAKETGVEFTRQEAARVIEHDLAGADPSAALAAERVRSGEHLPGNSVSVTVPIWQGVRYEAEAELHFEAARCGRPGCEVEHVYFDVRSCSIQEIEEKATRLARQEALCGLSAGAGHKVRLYNGNFAPAAAPGGVLPFPA